MMASARISTTNENWMGVYVYNMRGCVCVCVGVYVCAYDMDEQNGSTYIGRGECYLHDKDKTSEAGIYR